MYRIRTRTRRAPVLVAATVASLVAVSSVAYADAVVNSLDNSIDNAKEQMNLTVGGSASSAQIRVLATGTGGGDGDPERNTICNVSAAAPLIVDVASDKTNVATVSPSSLTFSSCDAPQTVTVTPVGVGTSNVDFAEASSSTATGDFNFFGARFQAVVASQASNTAPTVAVAGVSQGANYALGSVPAASCEVTDAEDGEVQSFPASLSAITGPYAADGIGSQTATCSYTDKGTPGLTDTDSVTYSISDPSAPVIGYTLTPANPDGLAGWYRNTVTLTWNVTEPQSPYSLQKTGCVDQTVNADQLPTTYPCSANSAGGSSGDPVTVTIKRDGNGPSVSYTSSAPTTGPDGVGAPDGLGLNGWYVAPVVATFTATDGFSGPATQTGTITSTTDGPNVILDSPEFTDNAGNKTLAGTATSPTPGFKIDTVDPDTPTWVDGPAAGSSHYFGTVPEAPTCTSSDATSLLDDCVVTGYTAAVGTHTLTATATDNAGNTSTSTRTYTVLAWTLKGFYSPTDMQGVWNTVKAGATVPLKFEVFAGPNTELIDYSVVDSFAVKGVPCPLTGYVADDIELLTTGGTILRYDSTGGQFIQNWQTPKRPGSCYSVAMTTDDGSSISANFQLK